MFNIIAIILAGAIGTADAHRAHVAPPPPRRAKVAHRRKIRKPHKHTRDGYVMVWRWIPPHRDHNNLLISGRWVIEWK